MTNSKSKQPNRNTWTTRTTRANQVKGTTRVVRSAQNGTGNISITEPGAGVSSPPIAAVTATATGTGAATVMQVLVGYARVSTQDQTLNLQKDALEKAGCVKIFTDTISGSVADRKGLEEALRYMRAGDNWWCGSSTGWAGR